MTVVSASNGDAKPALRRFQHYAMQASDGCLCRSCKVCLLAASILLCYWRHKVLCKRRRTAPPSPAKPALRPKPEPSNGRAPSLQQWLTDSLKDLNISRVSPSDVLDVNFHDADQRPGMVLIPRPALHSSVMAAPYACLLQQEMKDLLLQTMLFVGSQ